VSQPAGFFRRLHCCSRLIPDQNHSKCRHHLLQDESIAHDHDHERDDEIDIRIDPSTKIEVIEVNGVTGDVIEMMGIDGKGEEMEIGRGGVGEKGEVGALGEVLGRVERIEMCQRRKVSIDPTLALL
jgi:hypothetical protein